MTMHWHGLVAAWFLGALAAVGDAFRGGGGGGGGGGGIDYSVPGLKISPSRGTTGDANDGQLVYGPMEAGFSAQQTTQNFGCTNGLTLSGGIDTLTAEQMVHAQAAQVRHFPAQFPPFGPF